MICKVFKSCSREVLNWITKQQSVNEESISDWLLYKLSDLEPKINYLGFNRFEEAATTGADYELWVIGLPVYYRFRIQAKRLRKGHDHYSSIAYSNRYGLQIDKLIKDANILNYIPLYAFYNEEKQVSRCQGKVDDEGVYLAMARELYNAVLLKPKTFIDTAFLIGKSLPISCWFCCPLINRTPGGGFLPFLNNYFNLSDYSEQGQYKVLPFEISNLIQKFRSDNPESIWDFQFDEDYKDLKGIIVIDIENETTD
ncbi:hypothetical protein ASF10_23120 [Flavobacterium sp. Leaf82]|uniref:DUF6615 family protein n=1 Tax=Flavobacterium sp. Leaf82 TaxID=1736238 RepID=UPI0006F78515|nr:DUF6615 family protein [Flavobacterium sp. Leaf82]KQO28424.1 hypothetical protein ASF10_23120 [Flavobacterium sp. Leaf82]